MSLWSSATLFERTAPAHRRRQGNPENGARLQRDLDTAGVRARAARVAAPRSTASPTKKHGG
jgi:hypothetical protein